MPYYSRIIIILNSFYNRLFPKLFRYNRHMPNTVYVVYIVYTVYIVYAVYIIYRVGRYYDIIVYRDIKVSR